MSKSKFGFDRSDGSVASSNSCPQDACSFLASDSSGGVDSQLSDTSLTELTQVHHDSEESEEDASTIEQGVCIVDYSASETETEESNAQVELDVSNHEVSTSSNGFGVETFESSVREQGPPGPVADLTHSDSSTSSFELLPPKKLSTIIFRKSQTGSPQLPDAHQESRQDSPLSPVGSSETTHSQSNEPFELSHLSDSLQLSVKTIPPVVNLRESPPSDSCVKKKQSALAYRKSVLSDEEDSLKSDSEHRASSMLGCGASVARTKKVVDLVGEDTQKFKVGYQTKKVQRQYMKIEHMLQTRGAHLPDGGAQLRAQKAAVVKRLKELKASSAPQVLEHSEMVKLISHKKLTSGAIVHFHSNSPTEDTLAEDPPELTLPLMKHQKRALAWMLWRECQTPAAGILADDMGLGKTLSMLSLVWTKRGSSEEIRAWRKVPPPKSGLVKSPATLVICPASLMLQWQEEATSKIRGRVSVYVYHGKKITTNPNDLVHHDLVVTTYHMLGIEEASCEPDDEVPKRKRRTTSHTTLFKIHWRRVILDEVQYIKNPKSGMSMGACKLSADYRWAVTGTPIQNRLKDFYSLIKFIHLAPFDDFRIWKDTVEKKGSLGMQRLNTMVSSLILRRTKEELSSDGELSLQLTKKIVEQHNIALSEDEMAIHKYMYNIARKVMYSWLQEKRETVTINPSEEAEGADAPKLHPDIEAVVNRLISRATDAFSKGSCVLWLLLRLRQSCCHMKLLINNLDEATPEPRDDIDLEPSMDDLGLDSPPSLLAPVDLSNLPEIFSEQTASTKIRAVVTEIKRISAIPDTPPQKCVVVSQWTKMLDIVDCQLVNAGISLTRIDGTMRPAKRLERVRLLNSQDKNPSVMLLSPQVGCVGLDLIGANHIFILDMHWNSALEQQAADRCHRVGQTRDVHIHKFVCADTVEERILHLQTQKLELASNVMTGASLKNKLSLDDLKNLFEL